MTELSITLFGHPIRCSATRLDSGIHVLLTGGCQSHIGAVTTAEPGMPPETKVFPGHKDQFISEPWASRLAKETGQRACVVCGIHYDGATREQIAEILDKTSDMLETLLEQLS